MNDDDRLDTSGSENDDVRHDMSGSENGDDRHDMSGTASENGDPAHDHEVGREVSGNGNGAFEANGNGNAVCHRVFWVSVSGTFDTQRDVTVDHKPAGVGAVVIGSEIEIESDV